MTFVAAVATGAESAEALGKALRARLTAGTVTMVQHGPLAVAWATACPWIQSSDDGELLVVLDGVLHASGSSPGAQAELLRRRYQDRGVNFAQGVLGDFVAIVLDRATGTLLVARDPVGVRPWFQATRGRRHAGASEVATLSSLPWTDTAVDERIAIEYLAAVPESRGATLHRGIKTLRPGCTWRTDGDRHATVQHHHWVIEPELDIPWDHAVERCREVLGKAVRTRLEVMGPPTSQLSGGLDSSSLVGTLALQCKEDVLVGRLVFDGMRADECQYSDAVIKHWRLRALSVPPWIPSEDEQEELGRQLRVPVPDPNFTMFTDLHRSFLREGRRDGFTGLGGDDAFIAYGIGPRVVSAIQLKQIEVLADLGRLAVRTPRTSWSEILRPTLGYLVAPWRTRRRPKWVSEAAAARVGLAKVIYRRPARVTGVSAIDERLSTFTSGYNAAILEMQSLASDWLGWRSSHPFLDPRFVAATYGLDPSWPTRGGHYRALQVAAFGDRLPSAVADRRSKAEFSEVFWPQTMADHVLDRTRQGPLADTGWLDEDGFELLVADARRGMANAAIPLARCVALDRWMRAS